MRAPSMVTAQCIELGSKLSVRMTIVCRGRMDRESLEAKQRAPGEERGSRYSGRDQGKTGGQACSRGRKRKEFIAALYVMRQHAKPTGRQPRH